MNNALKIRRYSTKTTKIGISTNGTSKLELPLSVIFIYKKVVLQI
jgi:hypothetical protein